MAEDEELELDEEGFVDIPVDVVHSVVAPGGGALQLAQESGGGDALHPAQESGGGDALHPAQERGGVAPAVEVVPRQPDAQGTDGGDGDNDDEIDIVIGDYMEGADDDDEVFSSTCVMTVVFTLLGFLIWVVFLYGAAKIYDNYFVRWFQQQPPVPSPATPPPHTYDADADSDMRCPWPCPTPTDLQVWRNLLGEDGDAYASHLLLANASAAVLPVDTLRVAAGAPYPSIQALLVAAVILAVLVFLVQRLLMMH